MVNIRLQRYGIFLNNQTFLSLFSKFLWCRQVLGYDGCYDSGACPHGYSSLPQSLTSKMEREAKAIIQQYMDRMIDNRLVPCDTSW